MKLTKNLVLIAILNLFSFVAILSVSPAIAGIRGDGRPIAGATTDTLPIASSSPTPTAKAIQKTAISPAKKPAPTQTDPISPPASDAPPTQEQTPAPSSPLTTAEAPVPLPLPDPLAGRCIIVIDGARYDVTDFRNLHSGGDVFTCGGDESQSFHNRHPGSFLSKMARYRV